MRFSVGVRDAAGAWMGRVEGPRGTASRVRNPLDLARRET